MCLLLIAVAMNHCWINNFGLYYSKGLCAEESHAAAFHQPYIYGSAGILSLDNGIIPSQV